MLYAIFLGSIHSYCSSNEFYTVLTLFATKEEMGWVIIWKKIYFMFQSMKMISKQYKIAHKTGNILVGEGTT